MSDENPFDSPEYVEPVSEELVEPADISGLDPQQVVLSTDPDVQDAQDALIASTATGQAMETDPVTGEETPVDQPGNATEPEAPVDDE